MIFNELVSQNPPIIFAFVILIITIIINIILAIVIFIKNPKDRINLTFSIFIFFMAIWQFTILMVNGVAESNDSVLFWVRMTMLTPNFIPSIFLYFALIFPKRRKIGMWFYTALFIPSILLTIFLPTEYNVKTAYLSEFGVVAEEGIIYPIFIIYFAIYVGVALFLLTRSYKSSIGLKRLQLKYILYGSLFTAIIAIVTNAIFPLLNIDINIIGPYGAAATIILSLSISYSVVRHRLMDIRVVLRKGFVHTITLVILLGIYTYLALLIQDYFELDRIYTTLLAVLVIAITIYPLRKWLFTTIDSFFYEKDSKKRSLEGFSSQVASGMKLEELYEKAKGALIQGLGLEEVGIFILDKDQKIFKSQNVDGDSIDKESKLAKYLEKRKRIVIKEEIPYLIQSLEEEKVGQLKDVEEKLENQNAEVVIPLGDETIFGFILLGPKKSQEAFTVQDIRFLSSFAKQFTLYLGNALLYKQAVERIETQKD